MVIRLYDPENKRKNTEETWLNIIVLLLKGPKDYDVEENSPVRYEKYDRVRHPYDDEEGN